MKTQTTKDNKILKALPDKINDTDVLLYLREKNVNWEYVQTLKDSTNFNDEILSDCLNVSVKTFRSYKKPKQEISTNLKEHVLLFLSLIQHGNKVFNSIDKFEEWLLEENFYFNEKAPIEYLKTITGIRYIDDRLTALEFGDNV